MEEVPCVTIIRDDVHPEDIHPRDLSLGEWDDFEQKGRPQGCRSYSYQTFILGRDDDPTFYDDPPKPQKKAAESPEEDGAVARQAQAEEWEAQELEKEKIPLLFFPEANEFEGSRSGLNHQGWTASPPRALVFTSDNSVVVVDGPKETNPRWAHRPNKEKEDDGEEEEEQLMEELPTEDASEPVDPANPTDEAEKAFWERVVADMAKPPPAAQIDPGRVILAVSPHWLLVLSQKNRVAQVLNRTDLTLLATWTLPYSASCRSRNHYVVLGEEIYLIVLVPQSGYGYGEVTYIQPFHIMTGASRPPMTRWASEMFLDTTTGHLIVNRLQETECRYFRYYEDYVILEPLTGRYIYRYKTQYPYERDGFDRNITLFCTEEKGHVEITCSTRYNNSLCLGWSTSQIRRTTGPPPVGFSRRVRLGSREKRCFSKDELGLDVVGVSPPWIFRHNSQGHIEAWRMKSPSLEQPFEPVSVSPIAFVKFRGSFVTYVQSAPGVYQFYAMTEDGITLQHATWQL